MALTGGLAVLASLAWAFRPLPPPGRTVLTLICHVVNIAHPRRLDVLDFPEKENADRIFLMEVDAAWIKTLRPLQRALPSV